jgi:hypothetical protein
MAKLSKSDAANAAGVSRQTLYAYLQAGCSTRTSPWRVSCIRHTRTAYGILSTSRNGP